MSVSETRRDRLMIFAKYPRAGEVKTRLHPALSPESTADLYRAFLMDAVDLWRTSTTFEVVVCVADERDVDAMRTLLLDESPGVSVSQAITHSTLPPLRIIAQDGASLGVRLTSSFRRAFDEGCDRVCAIGTDHPTLPRSYVDDAFERVGDEDFVIGEADDGGYWLIGMDASHDELFEDMPFSTDLLFASTLHAAETNRLRVRRLPRWYDVDDADGLRRLLDDRAMLLPTSRTRALIESGALTGARASSESGASAESGAPTFSMLTTGEPS